MLPRVLLDLTLALCNGLRGVREAGREEGEREWSIIRVLVARGYLPAVIFRPRQRIDLISVGSLGNCGRRGEVANVSGGAGMTPGATKGAQPRGRSKGALIRVVKIPSFGGFAVYYAHLFFSFLFVVLTFFVDVGEHHVVLCVFCMSLCSEFSAFIAGSCFSTVCTSAGRDLENKR